MPRHINLPLPVRADWQKDALCPEYPHVNFFPEGKHENAKEALSVCGRCLVTEECLATALANNEGGIWGGTTKKWRQKIRHDQLQAEREQRKVAA